jgi:hypothetical protein
MIFVKNRLMKKSIMIVALGLLWCQAKAQTIADSTSKGKVMVFKDNRLEELSKKEAAFNDAAAVLSGKTGKGFRLMILNTDDRPLAMKVRAQLLQRFPEQKVYMSFQPPFIKLKFGNFLTKQDAEKYKKDIVKYKIVTGNIYFLPEIIETKPDKNKEEMVN